MLLFCPAAVLGIPSEEFVLPDWLPAAVVDIPPELLWEEGWLLSWVWLSECCWPFSWDADSVFEEHSLARPWGSDVLSGDPPVEPYAVVGIPDAP